MEKLKLSGKMIEVDMKTDQVIEPKYPEYIMAKIRQRMGLESEDTSLDWRITKMSKMEVFNQVLLWEGLIGFDYALPHWIKDIFGVDLEGL